MAQASLPIDLDPPERVEIDADRHREWLLELLAACRAVCRELTYEQVAGELDKIFGGEGRSVSASTLRASLAGTERNYARIEWAFWFARHSERVADLLDEATGRSPAVKSPADELRDLQALVVAECGRTGAKLVERAAVVRRGRR